MSYQVVNLTRHEIVSELNERTLAIAIAKQMAMEGDYQEIWGVIEMTTIYESEFRESRNDRAEDGY